MAINSIVWNGFIGICSFIYNISNTKLMQEVIAYLLVALAVVFLVKKYIFPSKKGKGCSPDCGC